jgi:hypothetical protein
MQESTDHSNNPERDPELWEIAKRRASFKYHLGTYVAVISFLWIIWYLTGSDYYHSHYPWPVWPSFGWGIGLTFHFLGAYVSQKDNSVEREYEKLVRNKKNTNY